MKNSSDPDTLKLASKMKCEKNLSPPKESIKIEKRKVDIHHREQNKH